MTPPESEQDAVPDPSQLAAFYSEAAEPYRELWAPQLLKLSRTLLDELPLPEAHRVLDAGCGVGTLLPEISARASGAAVYGIDVAEGMLALAPDGFPVAVMDATTMSFRPGSFDVGLFAFVLFHLPDPLAGMTSMFGALADGGVVGTLTWGDDPTYPAWDVWNEELDAAGAELAGPILSRHDLVDEESKVIALLKEAGFTSIRAWLGEYQNPMTPEDFLAHRTGHGASRRRFDTLDEEGRAMCLQRVRSRLRDVPPEGFVDRAEVIYAIGVKH